MDSVRMRAHDGDSRNSEEDHTMHTTRATRRLIPAVSAVAALVICALPAEASAEMLIINEPFSVDEGGQFTDCGPTIDWAVHIEGQISIRTGKGKEASAFFAREQSSGHEEWTDADTGDVLLTIDWRQQIHDIKATRLDGSVFEFTTTQVGQPLTVRDGDGNVLVRDRGLIAFTYTFDTLGDDVPGGEFVEDVGVRIAGPHPGFDLDLCTLL